MRLHRKIKLVPVLLLFMMSTGCSTISYYSQAVGGHLKLMNAREPVEKLINSDSTEPELKQKLQTLVDARKFASQTLLLPENDSYNTYVETGRKYVTWNVVAAEEFSLRAKTWCFPVAGCVSYKGYFAEEDAKAYAKTLADENLDVNIGGASAYSTLGWFDDPILDTMLSGGDIRYVSTLFHELAHQVLYIKDDSNFNEAFATFVEQQGIRIWLEARNENDRIKRYDAYLARNADFSELLKSTRGDLLAVYKQDLPIEEKRAAKQGVFDEMQENYQQLKVSWNGYSGYDGWFSRKINNARLVSVATYHRLVPAFRQLYLDSDEDLEVFYDKARTVADLPSDERRRTLDELLQRASNT